MRRTLFLSALLFIAALGYVAAPFYTAWTIRDAAKTGKPHVLASHVYWPTVKVSLKKSLKKIAVVQPQSANTSDKPPGFFSRFWTRIKTSFSYSAVDRLVDRYGNPDGFARIFDYGRIYRTKIRGWKDPEEGLPLLQKIQAVWARVKRAEFISLTRFEMDMIDKFEPGRMYCGVLEFRDWRWMLTELRVLQNKKAPQQVARAINWIR